MSTYGVQLSVRQSNLKVIIIQLYYVLVASSYRYSFVPCPVSNEEILDLVQPWHSETEKCYQQLLYLQLCYVHMFL